MVSVQLITLLTLLVCYSVSGYDDRVEQLAAVSKQLARQLMLQQLYVDEQTRANGDSGIKQIRMRTDGTKPYYAARHTGKTVASMHDHSDLVATSGMGEMIVVLNGVEFRTRHNDYKLKMPSNTSHDYHATEDITFPEVPPEVQPNMTIDEQIFELRKWFKAWKEGSTSPRDYRKYFKPLMCYLEGAWTTDTTTVEEPFQSDRHHIAAESWQQLQERIRFTSYTGGKNLLENFAYLPTTIMNVTDDGVPVFGQWNYRILCHPIQGIDLKLTDLKVIDDLPVRLSVGRTYERYPTSRGARYRISRYSEDQEHKWDLLDQIMKQIPGMDNYGANIPDDFHDIKKLDVFNNKPLNNAYYHRWYGLEKKSANGDMFAHRGFADRNLFVAQTTQPRVAPASYEFCVFPNNPSRRNCSIVEKRFSYAIPLEVIWLTPLNTWNPYSIDYKGDYSTERGSTVYGIDSTRNGGMEKKSAYDGVNSKAYYITPHQFFSGGEVESDVADTTPKGSVGVLDGKEVPRAVVSSGIRIFLPDIMGLGVLRTRYPVMPVYAEGSTVWKEVEALRDIVMDMGKYMRYFEVSPPFGSGSAKPTRRPATYIVLHTSASQKEPIHEHTVELVKAQYNNLTKKKKIVSVSTSEADDHTHELNVKYNSSSNEFIIVECDGSALCPGGHSDKLTPDA